LGGYWRHLGDWASRTEGSAFPEHPPGYAVGWFGSVSIQQRVLEISNCILNAKAGDQIWVDNPSGIAICVHSNPGTPDFSALTHRVFIADRWARTVARIAPKPGPGRKRDTARELTAKEKEQAFELIHTFYRAAGGEDAEAIKKAEGFTPHFCLDQIAAAFGPPRPLDFSVPIVREGKVVAYIPIRLQPKEVKDAIGKYREAQKEAIQMLRQIGFDSAFIKSFEKEAWRAELKTNRYTYRPESREEVRGVWAALWSDILIFLNQRKFPVSNVIAAHIALSLWENHGVPRPMTSRNKQGNTKSPTFGGIRQMFDRFAVEYAPEAESLLRIVEEEKARHVKEQHTASGKKKPPRR
jgi:hypothetical protein